MPQRYFTVDEAEHLIPFLEKVFARMSLVAEQCGQLQGELISEGVSVSPEGPSPESLPEPAREKLLRLQELLGEARTLVGRVEETGAQVKDLEKGLVDFPARKGSNEVYLCWQLGESAIGFWHTQAEGFAGRKPLERPQKRSSFLN